MKKFTVSNHPLIQHKLTITRKKDTGTSGSRRIVGETGSPIVYEMTRDLPLKNVEIETPIGRTTQKEFAGKKLVTVPILRADLGMVDGILQMIPPVKVDHIGVYHDEEALKPHEYFFKMPQDIEEHDIIIVNPMLATGGFADMTIDALGGRGAKSIRLAILVVAPGDIRNIQETYPDVDTYAVAEDEKLMGNGYTFPGLGDVGDRLFGTK